MRRDSDAGRYPHEIAVEARTRWDAVELLRRLHALRTARTYMVQNAPDQWLVYARPHGRAKAAYDELERTVDTWRVDRGLSRT